MYAGRPRLRPCGRVKSSDAPAKRPRFPVVKNKGKGPHPQRCAVHAGPGTLRRSGAPVHRQWLSPWQNASRPISVTPAANASSASCARPRLSEQSAPAAAASAKKSPPLPLTTATRRTGPWALPIFTGAASALPTNCANAAASIVSAARRHVRCLGKRFVSLQAQRLRQHVVYTALRLVQIFVCMHTAETPSRTSRAGTSS